MSKYPKVVWQSENFRLVRLSPNPSVDPLDLSAQVRAAIRRRGSLLMESRREDREGNVYWQDMGVPARVLLDLETALAMEPEGVSE